MTGEVLILRKRRTICLHVRDTFSRFSTESTKGVIRMIGLGLTDRPLSVLAVHKVQASPRWCV